MHKSTVLYRQAEPGSETRKELDSKDAITAQYCNKPNHPRGASKREGDTYVIDNQQIEWEDRELNEGENPLSGTREPSCSRQNCGGIGKTLGTTRLLWS